MTALTSRSRKRRRILMIAIAGTALVAGLFWSPLYDFFRGYAEGESDLLRVVLDRNPNPDNIGQVRFTFDDFGSLNTDTLQTNAVPWKLAATALVMERQADGAPVSQATLRAALSDFGFIWPESLANWTSATPPPPFERPLGIVAGMVSRNIPNLRVEVANMGCPACHGGRGYDAKGLPTGDVWLGLPNTSLDLESYVTTLYRGFKTMARDPEATLDVMTSLFPDVDPLELETLRKYVIPAMQERLPEIEASYDGPTPHPNGSPGVTNGVASLKFQLGLTGHKAAPEGNGFTSIPDLGDTTLRSSLLYDGFYTVPGTKRFRVISRAEITDQHRDQLAGIATFFIVPSMGVSPRRALDVQSKMEEIMEFVAEYTAPPFPGSIDQERARRGSEVYRAKCAECHGSYSEADGRLKLASLPNRLIKGSGIGTDPRRYEVVDAELVDEVNRSAYRKHIDAGRTGGYVGKPLSGLWATAPYLHNGSVPTLWHLFYPGQRPARFMVGGHRLDYEKLGLMGKLDSTGVYRDAEDYSPWSRPKLYDTAEPGCSNAGHEKEFEALDDNEKLDLLEFMKRL